MKGNNIRTLLSAQRDVERTSLRCCIALSVLVDVLPDRDDPALHEARKALAERHAAVLSLEAAFRALGVEPPPRDFV